MLGLAALLVLLGIAGLRALRCPPERAWTFAAAAVLGVFALFEPVGIVLTPLLFFMLGAAGGPPRDVVPAGAPARVARVGAGLVLAAALAVSLLMLAGATLERWGRAYGEEWAYRAALRVQPWRVSATERLALRLAVDGRGGDAAAAAEARDLARSRGGGPPLGRRRARVGGRRGGAAAERPGQAGLDRPAGGAVPGRPRRPPAGGRRRRDPGLELTPERPANRASNGPQKSPSFPIRFRVSAQVVTYAPADIPRRPRIARDVMAETGTEYTPEHSSGAPRRGLFRRPESPTQDPSMTVEEHRVAEALQRTIDERMEQGLRQLEEQATVLMREIASEMWRAGGSDARPEQERIVSLLSRDQALKSLIASSDERFQSLAVRSARLEDHLNELAGSARATREAMEASAAAIRDVADSPTLHGRGHRAHAARAGRGAHRARPSSTWTSATACSRTRSWARSRSTAT